MPNLLEISRIYPVGLFFIWVAFEPIQAPVTEIDVCLSQKFHQELPGDIWSICPELSQKERNPQLLNG